MGEIAINPIHNVHKQYRKVNLVNSYIFTPPVDLSTNTYIGGVAATISTAALLATKLGISVGAITNFAIVGGDIKCKITGSYTLSLNFNGNTEITYYDDLDGLVTAIKSDTFAGSALPMTRLYMPGVTSVTNGSWFFYESTAIKIIYLPRCTSFGSTVGNDSNIAHWYATGVKMWVSPVLQTCNSGSQDGDIATLITNGVTMIYVSNFTAPNPVTTLSAGTIYNTAIQLNFTAPTTTNAIEYYECYVNGVFKQNITASGQYISGLTPSTNYSITLVAVDLFYNKSIVSNSFSVTTTNTVLDSDANTYMIASVNGQWQPAIDNLFTSLKSNSLYTKIQAFYPFLGTTATQHKWNGKNPLDTNVAFRLTFSGSATFSCY